MSTLVENSSTIFERAVILKLTLGAPGNSSQLRPDQYKVDAAPGKTRAEKRLLESPEVAKIIKRQNRLRSQIKKLDVKSPLGDGTYLLGIDAIPLVEQWIDATEAELEPLKEEAERMYPQRVEEARVDLPNGLFDPDDYPPVAEFMSKFYISSRYITFAAPEALARVRGNLGSKLLAREQGKVDADTKATYENIFAVLRMDMTGLVDKLVDRTKRASAGDSTKFKGLLDNVTEFLDTLPMRNIVDSADLTALGERAKEILKDVTPDLIRENKNIREYVQKEFAAIQTTLGGLKTKRYFAVEEAA